MGILGETFQVFCLLIDGPPEEGLSNSEEPVRRLEGREG
jgi:hypothetical protein